MEKANGANGQEAPAGSRLRWVLAAVLAAVLVAGALGLLPASWTGDDAGAQGAGGAVPAAAGQAAGAGAAAGAAATEAGAAATDDGAATPALTFRSSAKLQEHFEKHGRDMGFPTAAEYEAAANNVLANPDALSKVQQDGDWCYYVPDTDEFVVVSQKGYLRTYFICSGRAYFDRQ